MKIVRFILALILLPCCVAVSRTVFFLLDPGKMIYSPISSLPLLAVGAGFVFWLLIFLSFTKPTRAYILAHELSHALCGALMGARVLGIRMSKTGGSVSLSQANLLSTLAPYFFPFYTALVILIYYIVALFVDPSSFQLLWLGLVGLTLGFHFSFMLLALSQPQSDIKTYGHFFSYVLIYLFNMLILGFLLFLISPEIGLKELFQRLVLDLRISWTWLWLVFNAGVRRAMQLWF